MTGDRPFPQPGNSPTGKWWLTADWFNCPIGLDEVAGRWACYEMFSYSIPHEQRGRVTMKCLGCGRQSKEAKNHTYARLQLIQKVRP